MLILASASPRRHELLRAAGIEHTVRAASIPEHRLPDESTPQLRTTPGRRKSPRHPPRNPADIVLGADTVVCLDDHLFGKPTDDDDARRMLRHSLRPRPLGPHRHLSFIRWPKIV